MLDQDSLMTNKAGSHYIELESSALNPVCIYQYRIQTSHIPEDFIYMSTDHQSCIGCRQHQICWYYNPRCFDSLASTTRPLRRVSTRVFNLLMRVDYLIRGTSYIIYVSLRPAVIECNNKIIETSWKTAKIVSTTQYTNNFGDSRRNYPFAFFGINESGSAALKRLSANGISLTCYSSK